MIDVVIYRARIGLFNGRKVRTLVKSTLNTPWNFPNGQNLIYVILTIILTLCCIGTVLYFESSKLNNCKLDCVEKWDYNNSGILESCINNSSILESYTNNCSNLTLISEHSAVIIVLTWPTGMGEAAIYVNQVKARKSCNTLRCF